MISRPHSKRSAVEVPKSGVIRVDRRLCLECRECEVACSLYHEKECNPQLSRIHVIFDDFIPEFPTHDVCQQCDKPECYYACISVCEEPAMYIDQRTGARVIDEFKCNGCGACAEACPFMPRKLMIGYKEVNGMKVFFKCDLCKDRSDGPVCVDACPPGALKFIAASQRYEK